MQVVEQHIIGRNDTRYAVIDAAAFASKNLYNAANYLVRQTFIYTGVWLHYETVYHQMKTHEAYHALPTKVSQQVMKLLDKNWKAYLEACKAWNEAPGKFLGHPKLPKYKDKQKGRNILVYTIQAMSKTGLKRGVIAPSGLAIEVKTQHTNVDCVRIIPRNGYYVVEVVYKREVQPASVDPALVAAIDLGVNNLATLTSNKVGFIPRLVNGRPAKSVNQFYNKQHEPIQKELGPHRHTSRRMEHLMNTRTRRIDHYLHTASKRIIHLLVQESISTLVVGLNPLWKQDPTMSKQQAQHFVQLPHKRFIDMLTYKATLVGIRVIVREESYTSKASFLDLDDIPTYGKLEQEPVFRGHRVKRGMYRASGKRYINANVNGSYNILRKVVPDAVCKGIEGMVVCPRRLCV